MAPRRPCTLCRIPTRLRWSGKDAAQHGRADLIGKPVCGTDAEALAAGEVASRRAARRTA